MVDPGGSVSCSLLKDMIARFNSITTIRKLWKNKGLFLPGLLTTYWKGRKKLSLFADATIILYPQPLPIPKRLNTKFSKIIRISQMQKIYIAVLYSTYKQLEKHNVKSLIIESNKTSGLSGYKLDKWLERLIRRKPMKSY